MTKTMASISPDARYFFRRAMEAEARNNPVQVIEYFDRAIRMDPGYASAWNEKRNYLDLMGKLDEALSCYDVALKLDPELSEAWFNKGLTLKKMGRDGEGIVCIDKGIEFACGR